MRRFNCCSQPPKSPQTILLLGLDNSGKTTLFRSLQSDHSIPKTSWGFTVTTLPVSRTRIKFYDVGGHERIRGIWKNYYAESFGFIFMVALRDGVVERREEMKRVWEDVVADARMARKPVLIIVNDHSSTPTQLTPKLEIETLLSLQTHYPPLLPTDNYNPALATVIHTTLHPSTRTTQYFKTLLAPLILSIATIKATLEIRIDEAIRIQTELYTKERQDKIARVIAGKRVHVEGSTTTTETRILKTSQINEETVPVSSRDLNADVPVALSK